MSTASSSPSHRPRCDASAPRAAANPEGKALHDRLTKNDLSPGWEEALPSWDADAKGSRPEQLPGKC